MAARTYEDDGYVASVALDPSAARRRVYPPSRPTRDLRGGTATKTVWGEELVDDFWVRNPAYPGPRPRTLQERLAAGVISPEAAALLNPSTQMRPRHFTFFGRFATAGYSVNVSPAFRGPALIKSITFTHLIDGSGQPSEIGLIKSLDNTGQGAFGSGDYFLTSADESLTIMQKNDFGDVFAGTNFLPSSGVGTNVEVDTIVLNHLVTDDVWYFKLKFKSPNVGTNEIGGIVLIYENIDLAHLADYLG